MHQFNVSVMLIYSLNKTSICASKFVSQSVSVSEQAVDSEGPLKLQGLYGGILFGI